MGLLDFGDQRIPVLRDAVDLAHAPNRVAAGRDLQGIMNLLPLQAPMDLSPCARPSSEAARRSRQCV